MRRLRVCVSSSWELSFLWPSLGGDRDGAEKRPTEIDSLARILSSDMELDYL
jgi:hypothetical protein